MPKAKIFNIHAVLSCVNCNMPGGYLVPSQWNARELFPVIILETSQLPYLSRFFLCMFVFKRAKMRCIFLHFRMLSKRSL